MKPPIPTERELDVLGVLWDRGPSVVAEVREALGNRVGYTGVLKLLQVMTTKGLVRRDESGRAHRYEATEPRERTEARLVRRLTDGAFGGSTANLVMRALSVKPATPGELRRIREILDEAAEGPR